MSSFFAEIEHCFKVTANIILPFPFGGFKPSDIGNWEDMELVHGIVGAKGRRREIRVAHAWIEGECPENGLMVAEFLKGSLRKVPQSVFYERRGVTARETVRFTREQVRVRIFQAKHYGPWIGAPAIHFQTMVSSAMPKPAADAKQSSNGLPPLIRESKHPDPLGIRERESASEVHV